MIDEKILIKVFENRIDTFLKQHQTRKIVQQCRDREKLYS